MPVSRIPVEWDKHDQPIPIAITFDDPQIDSDQDFFREATAACTTRDEWERACFQFADYLAASKLYDARREAIADCAALVVNEKDSHLAYVCICFGVGLFDVNSDSGTEWARKFGFSKQAFNQQVKRWTARLNLGPTRTMRQSEAREKMRLRNSRRTKPK
jgi:hypothetical protein